jgi:hypothetical protein
VDFWPLTVSETRFAFCDEEVHAAPAGAATRRRAAMAARRIFMARTLTVGAA